MAEGIFTITELDRIGGEGTIEGEKFTWTADKSPPAVNIIGGESVSFGGAFAAPRRPWRLSGQLRTVRTDYPGAKSPSEQVLTTTHQPFTLTGRFDDRYNFDGYAEQEMARLEALIRRGSAVRFSFQQQTFDGIITNYAFDYRRRWDIGYEITASVHDRIGGVSAARSDRRGIRSPITPRNPRQILDDLALTTEAVIAEDTSIPALALKTAIGTTVATRIRELGDRQDELEGTIDSRERDTAIIPTDPFRRAATQARALQAASTALIDDLLDARSDLDVSARTALNVLDFEVWTRGLRFITRSMLGQSFEAAQELDERSDPNAIALYRPHKGESLYGVSRRFYETPHGWRLIAERNNLSGITLTGNELLVIPEQGTV